MLEGTHPAQDRFQWLVLVKIWFLHTVGSCMPLLPWPALPERLFSMRLFHGFQNCLYALEICCVKTMWMQLTTPCRQHTPPSRLYGVTNQKSTVTSYHVIPPPTLRTKFPFTTRNPKKANTLFVSASYFIRIALSEL